MVTTNVTKKKEKVEESKMELAEGSADVTLTDIYAMFWYLVRQNKNLKEGNVMSFPVEGFKTLPKKPQLIFNREVIDGKEYLIVDIPDESAEESALLYVPKKKLILKKG
jgi:hypothetical protein